MTLMEMFESNHNVRLVRKDLLWPMRVANWLLRLFPTFRHGEFITTWWTTYRLPWQSKPIIAYPTRVLDPMSEAYLWVRSHELVHANNMRTSFQLVKMVLLYTLIPLPFLFSGRWFVERYAYLGDIIVGMYTPDEAADIIWSDYGWPWPRRWMIKWFHTRENEILSARIAKSSADISKPEFWE